MFHTEALAAYGPISSISSVNNCARITIEKGVRGQSSEGKSAAITSPQKERAPAEAREHIMHAWSPIPYSAYIVFIL